MIKSSAHSSTFLAGNLTNRVFPLASYSCICPSIKSFFCSPTMASTSTSTLCLKLLHMCGVLHPSCVAFSFDALHVDCFAILRLQNQRQLLVVVVVIVGLSIGSTASVPDSIESCLVHANCSSAPRSVSWHLSLKGVEYLAETRCVVWLGAFGVL